LAKYLRTNLITPFTEYFKCSDITAISNLTRIHEAGLEFDSVTEFEDYLRNTFNRDGTRKVILSCKG
jgi:hypothetical protein